MTDFFICSIKSPQCTERNNKKYFDSDFPSLCFDEPKRQISLPAGYKTARPGNDCDLISGLKLLGKQIFPTFPYFLLNSALLYHFLANLFAHNQKTTEKSVFHKASSPKITSLSFPVSCFWSHSFVPCRN